MTLSGGEIHDSLLGGRVFMLSAKTYSEMIRLLEESMSKPAADALMWNIGQRYGLALGRKVRMMSKSTDEGIKVLAFSAYKSGWGIPEVTNNLVASGTIEIVMTNCVFCDGLEEKDAPHCFFLSGVLNGIAESIYNTKFKTIETECKAMGGKACRFNVTKTE